MFCFCRRVADNQSVISAVSSHDMRFHLSDEVSAMVIMLVVQKNSDKMQGAGGGGGLKPMNG